MPDYANALIGHTGFVGGVLKRHRRFALKLHRPNIDELHGARVGTAICAAAPAEKWRANEDPEADRHNLQRLMDHLDRSRIDHLTLISTIDVYPDPIGVDEATEIDVAGHHPYGVNRFHLEEFVRGRFPDHLILRLPALFGPGLKKNFIYDLIHERRQQFTHHASTFQFYDLGRLADEIDRARGSGIHLLNVATEPLSARQVAAEVFGVDYAFETANAPLTYDARTRHAEVLGGTGGYLLSAEEVLIDLRRFVRHTRGALS